MTQVLKAIFLYGVNQTEMSDALTVSLSASSELQNILNRRRQIADEEGQVHEKHRHAPMVDASQTHGGVATDGKTQVYEKARIAPTVDASQTHGGVARDGKREYVNNNEKSTATCGYDHKHAREGYNVDGIETVRTELNRRAAMPQEAVRNPGFRPRARPAVVPAVDQRTWWERAGCCNRRNGGERFLGHIKGAWRAAAENIGAARQAWQLAPLVAQGLHEKHRQQ